MSRNGFTLIELIVVIFIIGIATTIVGGTLYRGMYEIHLKTSAKEISASLRYARSRAVAEKKVYSFVIDKKGYGLYTDTGLSEDDSEIEEEETLVPFPSPHWGEGKGEGVFSEEKVSYLFYKPLPDGVTVEYNGDEWFRIYFFPYGDSTGGEIMLKNKEGKSLLITVEQITGRVRVEG